MLRHAKTESLPTEGQYRAYLRHLRFEKRQLGTTVAATLSKLGREDEAGALLVRLRDNYPDFRPRAWLELWMANPQQLSQTVATLESLGMDLQ